MHAIKERKRLIAGFAGLALGIGMLFALAAEAALAPGTAFESILLHSVQADFGVDPGFRIKPLNFEIVAEALNDNGHGRAVALIPAIPPILRAPLAAPSTSATLGGAASASPSPPVPLPSPTANPKPKPSPTPSPSPGPTPKATPPGQSGRTVIVPAGTTRSAIVTSGNVIVYGTVTGDVVDTGGNVTIYGTVGYDLIAFGGNVTIYGTVNHDVTVYNGNLTLESTAYVGRNVTVSGGKLTRYPGSYVGGKVLVQ
jgi:cytoskeletal protein CcmA (bactofilin family)